MADPQTPPKRRRRMDAYGMFSQTNRARLAVRSGQQGSPYHGSSISCGEIIEETYYDFDDALPQVREHQLNNLDQTIHKLWMRAILGVMKPKVCAMNCIDSAF